MTLSSAFVCSTPVRFSQRASPRLCVGRVLVPISACAPGQGASASSALSLSSPPSSQTSSTRTDVSSDELSGEEVSKEGSAPQYVPLHVHSDFSLLDGASQLPDLVARAAELGVPALALTDHGVLYGAISLVKHCSRASSPVKPIIGNEMYVVNVDTPYVAPAPSEDNEHRMPTVSGNGVPPSGNLGTDAAAAAGTTSAEAKAGKLGTGKKGQPTKRKKKPPSPRRYHLIVLAKNTTGYRNLVELTTHAHLVGKVGTGIFARPSVNKALLYEHREGLIVSSGCLGGEVAQAILDNRPDIARDVARWFRDAFGDDYYLEIQDHGSAEDRIVNREVVLIGRELGIPVICTNDSHFTSCLDAEAHDALICIQTGKVLEDRNRLHYAGNEYFKSVDEMRQCFVDHLEDEDIEAALAATLEVADKVEPYDLFGDTRIPDFPVPPPPLAPVPPYLLDDHASYLRYVARKGMEQRLEARLASGLIDTDSRTVDDIRQEYSARLEFELDMIEKMGFSSYHLVVWDYIRYARDEGIPVGPGRGSAAGSLVAFALRITDVDPIFYNLLFERFLNPERKSMPDIDTDFSVEGREKIIRYVTEKYGSDKVAQIITFNRLTSKAVLKDVARVHQVPYAQADRLAKLIPVVRGKPAKLSSMLSEDGPSREFRDIVKQNRTYNRWLEKARRIEGANKTYGIHAAGVVISAEPLSETVPLSRAKHGETITQYPMEDVESMGLLKMDFLGLKNLSVIESTLAFINEKRRDLRTSRSFSVVGPGATGDGPKAGAAGEELYEDLDFSVDALPLDDPKTYDLLATGELDGIFQLDASAGMRNIVRELRPTCLEDVSAILALYRPGPLDAGLVPKFIDRKHGKEEITYDHPLLEPILKDTYGIMVYQEQIMRIARDLAGYSLGQADILRRAMGKKKSADMMREKPRFVEGAVGRGIKAAVATKLFEMMEKFAEYCFNKSHSTAYAYLTYQTAYLKANYPVEYAAALLRANSGQADKLVRYLADANMSGVRVLPPNINRSQLEFSVNSIVLNECPISVEAKSESHSERIAPSLDDQAPESMDERVVLFGLGAIKTVGDSVGCALIEEREARGPFKSIIDVIERVDSRVLNKRSMGALVACGAFDDLHPNRRILGDQLESLLSLHRKVRDRKKRREKKEMTGEEIEKAKAKDAAEWEAVQWDLLEKSESQPDFPMLEKLAAEKATLGFYASGHPLREFDEQILSMLGPVRMSDIIGEPSPSATQKLLEDTEEDTVGGDSAAEVGGSAEGSHHAPTTIMDGAEVMCLTLVSDLKRIVTAKGQKMAKWLMEDTSGRVPAVVFPNAYPICDAVVASDGVEGSEPKHVVENDARVVVWGKVVRESSGSVQVIVDDVQRVEDVTVLLASLPYTVKQASGESRPVRDRASLVSHVARRLQDPESMLNFSREGQEYSFTNARGEVVQARRRARKTNLATKARIPVIVREVGADGGALSYYYCGHGARFQNVSQHALETLKNETTCSFEIVHVGSREMYERSPQIDENSKSAPIPVQEPVSTLQAASGVVSRVEVVSSASDTLVDREARDDTPVLKDEALLSEAERRRVPFDPQSPQPKELVHTGMFSSLSPPCESPERSLAISETSTSMSQSGLVKSLLDIKARRSGKRPSLASVGAMESIAAHSESPSPNESYLPRAILPPVEGYASNPERVARSRPDEQPTDTERASSVYEAPASPASCASVLVKELEQSLSTDQRNLLNELRGVQGEAETAKMFLAAVFGSENRTEFVPTPGADDSRKDIESAHTPKSENEKESGIVEDPVWSKPTRKNTKISLTGVDVSNSNLGGLLDAMCHVGGEIAHSFTGHLCSVQSLDSTVVPEISALSSPIDIIATVGALDGSQLRVLVRVRENRPTGRRKRVRHLACSVVTFTIESLMGLKLGDSNPSDEPISHSFAPGSIQEKKDAAACETRLNGDGVISGVDGFDRESCDICLTFDFPARDSPDFIPVSFLRDGGTLLFWMARAAEATLSNVYVAAEITATIFFGAFGFEVCGEAWDEIETGTCLLLTKVSSERAGKREVFVYIEGPSGLRLAHVSFIAQRNS